MENMRRRRRRRMQWGGSIPILITLLMISSSIIVVHAGFNEEEDIDEDIIQDAEKMSLELVHRHDARFVGEVDQAEAMKGFIERDNLRRQRMNQRLLMLDGPNNNNNNISHSNRRKDSEINLQEQQHQQQFKMPMHAGRDLKLGEYFVQVKVGTPGQKFWLVADTGSEFTWFNCKEENKSHNKSHKHKKAHHHHHHHSHGNHHHHHHKHKGGSKTKSKSNPCNGVFCPHHSKSFQGVTCSSKMCKVDLTQLFSLNYCPNPSDPCLYDISYSDGSSAKGYFGSDTITVALTNGKEGKLHDVTIGCTKTVRNGITFNEKTGGILGLGFGKDSFVDKASLQYGAKFSYCLVDHLSHKNVSSYLTFGDSPHKVNVLGEMKKTELFLVPPFYGVNVVGISMGGQMLKIPPQVWDFKAQGGTIVDSGTTLTALTVPAFEPVLDALNKSLSKVNWVDGENLGLDHCFEGEGFDESVVPRMVFHFAGGVRFEPPVKSYIIDVATGVKCIGIVAVNGPGACVIGNIMQQNHLWEFDLTQETVGFAPSACST